MSLSIQLFYWISLLFTYQKGDDLLQETDYSEDVINKEQPEQERKERKMDTNQITQTVEQTELFTKLRPVFMVQPDAEIERMMEKLSPETPWGERQEAALKLGNRRDVQALPALLTALPTDPFWMVRCAIIQALEKIGSAEAITTLRYVADSDGFQVVRDYAEKAVERLYQAV